ncbi:MAG: CoA pyrophosphatase [Bacteroidota bacterium]
MAQLLQEEANAKAAFQKNPPRICAVMIALYEDQSELYVPMMLRPKKSRAHPGQVAFPGGKQEEQDQDLLDTAIREMEEEVGVRVPKKNVLGMLSPVYIPPSNSLVTPILGYLAKKPTYTIDPNEVERALDVPIAELQNPANKRAKKVVLTNGDFFTMPAFVAADVFIWGGTARMIMELNKLLAEFTTS